MQLTCIALIPLFIGTYPIWVEGSVVREVLKLAGLMLLLGCVFGRLWSILYAGGNKNIVLVTSGPYSITRNPLYLFSVLGAAAIGLLFGSLILATILGVATCAILYRTAQREAEFLQSKFGSMYDEYARRVPFFLPNFSLYVDSGIARFHPKALGATFRDSIFFMSVIPLVELTEYLRSQNLMPDTYPIF